MPDPNVIFQQPPKNTGNAAQNDPLDPFAKYQTPSAPVMPPVSPSLPPVQGTVLPTAFPGASPLPGLSPPPPPPVPPRPPSQSPLAFLMGLPMWIKIAAGVGIFLFFLLLILFSFRGGAASGGKVTLTYWGLWENKSTMDQLFADFHRQYPNITVVVSEEDPKQYSERLLTRIKNGTGPDVFAYHNSWIPEMLPVLSPLSTAAITTDEFTKSFYPVAQKDLINRGAIYGIPLEIDTLALFVNNNILKANGGAAPKTWDDFNAIAAAATVKDANGKIKTSGAAMGVYDNIIHASDIVAMLFAQNGANLTNLASTVKNASDALNFYSSFGSTAANNIWDTTLSPSLVGFSQGNVAMCFGYSYDIFAIRVMNPTLDFSVYPVPHLPNRPITIASYWVQGVSANSAHQKEAMLLMHFLAQKDTEEKMYALEAKTRPFGEPYARVDLADTLKNDPFIAPFLAQAPTAVSTYFSSSTYDTGLNAQMNGYLANTVRSILSNTSVDTAVTTLSQGVTQILQQYGVQ